MQPNSTQSNFLRPNNGKELGKKRNKSSAYEQLELKGTKYLKADNAYHQSQKGPGTVYTGNYQNMTMNSQYSSVEKGCGSGCKNQQLPAKMQMPGNAKLNMNPNEAIMWNVMNTQGMDMTMFNAVQGNLGLVKGGPQNVGKSGGPGWENKA